MNIETIFVKTSEGEAAMHQRTRLVQRNLRTVLIVVDGRSTVGELKKKLNDPAIAESSLEELERMGLIERLGGHGDRISSGSQISDMNFSSSVVGPPSQWDEDLSSIPPPDMDLASDVDDGVELHEPHISPGHTRAVESASGPQAQISKTSLSWEDDQDRGNESVYVDQDDAPIVPVKLKPIHQRGRMSPLTWVLSGTFALLLLLVSLMIFYPYGRHLPEVEHALEAAFGESVKIGAMEFVLAPYPHISLSHVTVGTASADQVRVVPEYGSLLTFSLVPRKVEILGAHLRADGLGRTARWFDGAGVKLRELKFSDLDVQVGEAVLTGYHGDVSFSPEGRMIGVQARNEGDSLSIEAHPVGAGYTCTLVGRNWRLPFGEGVVIEFLDGKGEISGDGLNLTQVEAKVFDGLVVASTNLSWKEGVSLSGKVDMRGLSLARLAAAFSPALSGEGTVNGGLRVDTSSGGVGQLVRTAVVRGNFEVQRGNIKRFDLTEAMRSTGRGATRGGKTTFEQLNGNIEIVGGTTRLSGLQLLSGLLVAKGEVRKGANDVLSGRLDAEMRGAAGQRSSIDVAGTLADPQLSAQRVGR
jgi:hypothetical protein